MTQFESSKKNAYTGLMTGSPPETHLAKALRQGASKRVTPLDAFHAAKRKWMSGERVEIGALATELGVGRATLFRWVGSRERLLGEILWTVCAQTLSDEEARTHLRGARRIAAILNRLAAAVREFPPMSAFLKQDPEYALRLLTSKGSPVQDNLVATVQRMLEVEVERGELSPPLPLNTLAFLVVRVCEAFVYAEMISDYTLGSANAGTAIELLLSGSVSKAPRKSTRSTSSRRT
jgi:AcrR family transcriptional regulator